MNYVKTAVLFLFLTTSANADFVITVEAISDTPTSPGSTGSLCVFLSEDSGANVPITSYNAAVAATSDANVTFDLSPAGISLDTGILGAPLTITGGAGSFNVGISNDGTAVTITSDPTAHKLFCVDYTIGSAPEEGSYPITVGLFQVGNDASPTPPFGPVGPDDTIRNDPAVGGGITIATAVPEPSSWMFMALVGFLGGGRSYWLKRKSNAILAA